MRYINESCPYCGQGFVEGDDVVVCPECGTPHHRGCWVAHGQCANSEKHGEGFAWQKSAEPEPEKNQTTNKNEANDKKSLDIVCPDCGKACPNGTLRCPDCGAMLVPFANIGMGEPPVAQFRPGFDANEDVGGIKSGEIALFCRVSVARYIKAFKKQAAGKKLGWNWGAAFFAPFWFFYRKLYKAGVVFMTLFVALNLWLLPVSEEFYEVYGSVAVEMERIMENEGEESAMAALEKRAPEIEAAMRSMYLPIIAQFLIHIVAALLADKLYWRKAKADISAARKEQGDERSVQLELFKKGGISFFAGLAAYLANEILLYLASYLIGV